MPANSLLFKPSVTQPISQTPYDLNNELLVRYSSHGPNNKLLVRYSGHGSNSEPFDERIVLDHLNTELVASQIPTVLFKKSENGLTNKQLWMQNQ